MQVPSQIKNENVNECDLVCESSTTECIQEHLSQLLNRPVREYPEAKRRRLPDFGSSRIQQEKLPLKSWQRPSRYHPLHYETGRNVQDDDGTIAHTHPGTAVRPSVMKASEVGVTQMLGNNG